MCSFHAWGKSRARRVQLQEREHMRATRAAHGRFAVRFEAVKQRRTERVE